MKYTSEIQIDARQFLLDIMNRLAQIEVRGDSVEHLFFARLSLKEYINSLKEIPEEGEDVS